MPFDFDDDDRMPVEQMTGPVLIVRARVRLADLAARAGPHRFGGALALDVRGAGGTRPALHRVLTLSLDDPLLEFSIRGVAALPLVYGFVYDGCRLKYRVTSDRQIEMLQMSPTSPSADWPYAKYPAAFPETRFALRDDGEIEPDQIDALTWQGVSEIEPAKGVIAIVPPSQAYGVSLWGEGNEELVQVVFEIDPKAGTVTASNQCG